MPYPINTIPISLYVHTPWCIRKCPYCDFNSHALRDTLPEKPYITALINDFKHHQHELAGRKIHSVFIGGGTPSLFSPDAFRFLFEELRKIANIPDNIEITLEANPGTTEQSRFKDYRTLGINRISLGIQSLQDDKLKILGRIHSAKEAIHAVKSAQNAGFDNINVDLMFGLPNQTLTDALYDLNTAIELQTTHLSWYQLTIEPNTHFHQFPPVLPEDDSIWEIQEAGQALLNNSGFEQYEISAYSKPNRHSQHNTNYWEFGDYLGIGAGAHSKITHSDKITRHWNVKHPKMYLSAKESYTAHSKIVTQAELPLEFMMNALRLHRPIPVRLFSERTGLSLSNIQAPLQQAFEKKLLHVNREHFIVTPLGRRFLNDLLEIF